MMLDTLAVCVFLSLVGPGWFIKLSTVVSMDICVGLLCIFLNRQASGVIGQCNYSKNAGVYFDLVEY